MKWSVKTLATGGILGFGLKPNIGVHPITPHLSTLKRAVKRSNLLLVGFSPHSSDNSDKFYLNYNRRVIYL